MNFTRVKQLKYSFILVMILFTVASAQAQSSSAGTPPQKPSNGKEARDPVKNVDFDLIRQKYIDICMFVLENLHFS